MGLWHSYHCMAELFLWARGFWVDEETKEYFIQGHRAARWWVLLSVRLESWLPGYFAPCSFYALSDDRCFCCQLVGSMKMRTRWVISSCVLASLHLIVCLPQTGVLVSNLSDGVSNQWNWALGSSRSDVVQFWTTLLASKSAFPRPYSSPLCSFLLTEGGCIQVYGLAGITLGSIVQSLSTVLSGIIVGFIYGWKLTLVGSSQFIYLFIFLWGSAQLVIVRYRHYAHRR